VEKRESTGVALVGNAVVIGKVGGGALKIGIKCRWKETYEMTVSGTSRSQWPRGLMLGVEGALLLGLRVRIRPGSYRSLVSVLCFQVEVSASGRSLVQRSPNECGVSECDRETSIMRRAWPTGSVGPWERRKELSNRILVCYKANCCNYYAIKLIAVMCLQYRLENINCTVESAWAFLKSSKV